MTQQQRRAGRSVRAVLAAAGLSAATGPVLALDVNYNPGDNNAAPVVLGDPTNRFILSGPGSATQSGVISEVGGARPVEILAGVGGTLIFSANNTYTGGTTITSGRLQIGNGANAGSILGNVVNNGVLAFNRIGFLTMNGVISGTGAVEKNVGGITVFTGENTYTGGTTINAGILQLGNGGTTGSILGNVAVNGTGLLVFNRSNSYTFAGNISGTGGLVQAGTGTVILTGTNTYTGGTSISAGVLQIGNGGTTGSIVGNVESAGVLAFNRSDTYTFTGIIADASEGFTGGRLVQMGPGTLVLTANHTYTGTTTVTAGTLLVNGSIASSSLLTVDPGATVGGIGTLPTSIINGTLSPGTSPGTVTVAGNLTFGAGSIYLVEVQGPIADRTNVTGTATLAGTVRLVPLGGSYLFNTPYTILSATGGRTGTFTTIDSLFGPSIRTTISYDANNVFLTLAAGTIDVAGLTINQQSVATGLNNAIRGGADASAFFPLLNLPAAAIPLALDQLGGEVHTARIALGFEVSDQFLRVMLDPFALGRQPGSSPALAYAPADALAGLPGIIATTQAADLAAAEPVLDTRRFALWAAAFGTDSRVRGEGVVIGSHTLDSRTANLAVGGDWRIAPDTVIGVAAAGGNATASLSAGLGSLSAEVGQVGAYVMTRFGGLNIGAALAYAVLDIDSQRNVPFLAATNLTADYTVQTVFGRIEASFEAARFAGFAFAPLAAYQAHAIRSPSVTETVGPGGVAAAALAINGETQHISRSELGLRIDGVTRFEAVEVTTFARLAWAHYFDRDNTFVAAFTGLPGSTFSIIGAQVDRDSALVSAGIDLRVTPQISFAARFDGEFSENVTRYAGTARVRWSF